MIYRIKRCSRSRRAEIEMWSENDDEVMLNVYRYTCIKTKNLHHSGVGAAQVTDVVGAMCTLVQTGFVCILILFSELPVTA